MEPIEFKTACESFVKIALPYLKITDDKHHEEALELVESLMLDIDEDQEHPMNLVIDMLTRSIEEYESQDEDVVSLENSISSSDGGVALLRVLMDQHQLKMNDLPEIGDKTLVSRVLSGERELNKSHITRLSGRFQISPSLFFH